MQSSADPLVGTAVVKDLDEPTSPKGRVTGYQPAHDWYTVQYEDGDQEYLMRDELQLLAAGDPRTSRGKVWIQAGESAVLD